jgi:hypothetical protein
VLFGGYGSGNSLGDTWIWNGTDWKQRIPAHAPSARYFAGMTYDAARGQVLLFGGSGYGDTWTWDGTDWTPRTPAHAPSPRTDTGMAYDATGARVVLFGGGYFGDTWTWDGSDWAIPFRAWIKLIPSSGPPGTVVQIEGRDFGAHQEIRLLFIDSVTGTKMLAKGTTDAAGAFITQVTIPNNVTPGEQQIKARAPASGQVRKRTFTVT